MALDNMKNMLADAQKGGYAVAAFDVTDFAMARTVVEAAEKIMAPVILMALTASMDEFDIEAFAGSMRLLAERAGVPVCLHLDHEREYNRIVRAVDSGFTSVMLDASQCPLEENIEKTGQAAEYAHRYGVTIEGELGHVGDGKTGGGGKATEGVLTEPSELKEFCRETGVDAVAVAVGTQHGIYLEKPKLDFERLARLRQDSPVPLVLHGGSGTPDRELEKAIRHGICKINVFSELMEAFFTELKSGLQQAEHMALWPSVAFQKPYAALQQVAEGKMKLFGSAGRA